MEYFIDTANAAAAAAVCRQYPVAGVTTNPTILAREGGEVRRVLAALRAAIGERLLHVQPVSEDAEGIVREARAVRALVGDSLAIKVPMTPEGLRAMRLLQSEGFPVTATAVFAAALGLTKPFAVEAVDAPASYLFCRDSIQSFVSNPVTHRVDGCLYTPALSLPGFLKWGDVTLAAALAEQTGKVTFVSPRTYDGTKYTEKQTAAMKAEIAALLDKLA